MLGVDLNLHHGLLFAIYSIYDHLFAPGKLFSNWLKFWHFLGDFLNLALFIKEECNKRNQKE